MSLKLAIWIKFLSSFRPFVLSSSSSLRLSEVRKLAAVMEHVFTFVVTVSPPWDETCIIFALSD